MSDKPAQMTETEGARCPKAAEMGEHACTNWFQCWEPCGRLGHDPAYMVVATDAEDIGVRPSPTDTPHEGEKP